MLVAYSIADEFEPARTETYDLGLGGLAMYTATEIAPGTALTLEVELRGDPRPPLKLRGAVRWSQHDAILERYRTGVEFTERSPEQEQALRGYIDTMYKLRDLGVL
jgi:c-di-GMP-binding flagellar brake protein YcgR